jgi:hypothetical protein
MPNVPNLDQLRAIHLPEPIGAWPLAWGWLGLLVLAVLLLMGGLYAGWCWYWHGRAKREALRLLAACEIQYRADGNSQQASASLTQLLKRVALAYFPREQVANLHGEPWLMFLQSTSKQIDVIAEREALLMCPYQADQSHPVAGLFTVARAWIQQRSKPCLS